MFYKVEISETVVRGITVYVEADSEEEARQEAEHETCWLDEVADDDHETVSREIDSVEPLDQDELDTVDFLTQCQECGAYALLTNEVESKAAPGCDCATEDDGADDAPPKLPNDGPWVGRGGHHGG